MSIVIKMTNTIKNDRVAAAIWKRTVPELIAQNKIETTDIATLENYCLAYANALRLNYWVKQNGSTQVTGKGVEIEAPQAAQERAAWKEVRACTDRLGINPASRQKLSGEGASGDDPFFN